LELKTATKIQIPRPDDASNQIRITGTKEGIEKARHEVLLISAEQVRPACSCAVRASVWARSQRALARRSRLPFPPVCEQRVYHGVGMIPATPSWVFTPALPACAC
jgi:hypothetical protein